MKNIYDTSNESIASKPIFTGLEIVQDLLETFMQYSHLLVQINYKTNLL